MDEVEIVEYDPRWPALYAEELARLHVLFPPGMLLAAEHFGSTAIPGLPAKPVIDMLVAVPDLATARARLPSVLEANGWAFWAENPRTDRLFFVKGLPPSAPRRTHHLHVTEPGAEPWQRLAFRDHLRAHPADAARYAALKRGLAERFREDREAYTAAKAAFVESILVRYRRSD